MRASSSAAWRSPPPMHPPISPTGNWVIWPDLVVCRHIGEPRKIEAGDKRHFAQTISHVGKGRLGVNGVKGGHGVPGVPWCPTVALGPPSCVGSVGAVQGPGTEGRSQRGPQRSATNAKTKIKQSRLVALSQSTTFNQTRWSHLGVHSSETQTTSGEIR